MLGIALARGTISRDALGRGTLPRHVMEIERGTVYRQDKAESPCLGMH